MLSIRRMTAADIPLGMRLKQQNGWNQLEADWRRFLDMEPDGCFVAAWNGQDAGTTCTCIFGDIAWIAMVLVDAEQRKRGIGTALMEHALAYLHGQGVRSTRLDATPLGQPVYEKLGFAAEFTLARFAGVLPAVPAAPGVEAVSAEALTAVCQLDRAVTATDRSQRLARLYAEQPDTFAVVRRGDALGGYVAARPGFRAWQLGPCLGDADAGP